MNNEKNNKIEQILTSLDANQRATAPDFFYTRLKARMEREQGQGNKANKPWILRPAYALTALIIVLIMNVAVILKDQPSTDNSATADIETTQSIAAEYSLNDSSPIFDLTLDK